jgi:transketolase
MAKLTPAQYKLGANTLRMLAVDAVEKANSGHPGMPMGAADLAFTLWHDFLQFDPKDPEWPNRDRFILSAGHGSMLLYGLLHLFGYEVTMDDIKNFRQWGSRTPGHPEFGHTPGVEVTTGPLGQGLAMGAGMALAAKMAGARFNTPEQPLLDHRVYVLASDGDLMEGISHEAASLAGHLRLDNLVCLYDDNGITIDGRTDVSCSDEVAGRFRSYGWHVQSIDGHDPAAVNKAVRKALKSGRPSLVAARTRIGQGSPSKQDTPACHGSPLGAEEAEAARKSLGCAAAPFHVAEEVRSLCRNRVKGLRRAHNRWQKAFEAWRTFNQEKAALWDGMASREVPGDILSQLVSAVPPEAAATRTISGRAIQKISEAVPSLACGSADLEGSTNIAVNNGGHVSPGDYSGRNIHYGIREHAMAAAMNGLARYGFFIPAGSTFLVFSDYCRPAIRLSALMKQQVVYVFTHDSVFLGEDGPTHQPVEHLSSLRLIPNLQVIRPADAVETAAAWAMALQKKDGPTALVLTRQKLPAIERDPGFSPEDVLRGAYAMKRLGEKPQVAIFASGSELALALAAGEILHKENIHAQIVSVPCLEVFLSQPPEYRNSVTQMLPTRVALEAGRGALWHQLFGGRGLVIGVEGFGASAPEGVLAEKLGLTPGQVADRIKQYLIETAYWT